MNSQIVSDPIIQSINATSLAAFGLITLILALGFRQGLLAQKASKSLFTTIVTATVAMGTYAICFFHHPAEHDVLYFISATVAYLAIYVAEYMYLRYLVTCININRNNPIPRTELLFTLLFCLTSAVLWMLSTGDGEFIIPEAPPTPYGVFFWIGHVGEWSLAISSILLIVWYHKLLKEKKMLILFVVPVLLTAATFIEPVTSGIALRYPALAIGLLIVYTRYHFKAGNASSVSEPIGSEGDFSLITNRVKPHFINNILSTIYYLCDMDVDRAKNVTMELSGYVSGTLGAVDYTGLVPFKREFDLIKHYIELEMLRFGDRMTVEYKTDELEFEIPPLTIQALVENSVKHGIAEKDGEGSIKLVTRRLADGSIQIKVTDDGIGFDASEPENISGELALIKNRIEQEANGTMSIKSTPGQGTSITIKLRQEQT